MKPIPIHPYDLGALLNNATAYQAINVFKQPESADVIKHADGTFTFNGVWFEQTVTAPIRTAAGRALLEEFLAYTNADFIRTNKLVHLGDVDGELVTYKVLAPTDPNATLLQGKDAVVAVDLPKEWNFVEEEVKGLEKTRIPFGPDGTYSVTLSVGKPPENFQVRRIAGKEQK